LFHKHLSLHQFGISTFKGCEAIPFGIQTLFNLHPDWVVMQVDIKNAFINIFPIINFKELCDVKGPLPSIVSFTKLFYGTHSSLYY
jgi:hypothetical protein